MEEEKTKVPVFVKIEESKEISKVIDLIKEKVKEVKTTLSELNRLRDSEKEELTNWSNTIEGIERKIEEINKIIF